MRYLTAKCQFQNPALHVIGTNCFTLYKVANVFEL